ncbi:hypothetical protein ATKI12_7713 [Kitasatospora sp. Ki12]
MDPEPPVPGPSRGGTGSQVAARPTLYGRPPVRAPREPGHRSVEAAGQWLAGAGVFPSFFINRTHAWCGAGTGGCNQILLGALTGVNPSNVFTS